ncbi:MAG: EscU/YscU/HrcU family type III secretion system export apparatus switch protein [Clostridiales bacterium]|nr:EscU/YscU/HrcU family type III secretion system export apparatus switch protein [Clostridiales bacterium]
MNKDKKAIALEYNSEEQDVPQITASGRGVVAERIIETAVNSNVEIYKNEELVKELIQFKVGTEIPKELYEIVAQILIFVEEVDSVNSLDN